KARVEPDLSICNTAIYVLVKGTKLEKALRFFERMQVIAIGIEPDIVTYNCLIKGYCDLHRIDDAMVLGLSKMPSKGCPPDKVNYYTVMAFLCNDKKFEEVKRLLENMVKNSNLIPDQIGDLEAALSVLDDMYIQAISILMPSYTQHCLTDWGRKAVLDIDCQLTVGHDFTATAALTYRIGLTSQYNINAYE
ncbi:pentatricopeptide repeat-containing protein, partial [Trifolium pratense]